MAVNVKKIVKNFDDEWMRVLFHEPDFLPHCLLLARVKQVQRFLRPFNCKLSLIMLSDCFENIGQAALSD